MSETQQRTYAIEALVRRRCDELGLTQPELIRRCGYQNVSKGLRRLEQLRASDFKKSAGLIDKLPAALEVPVEVIKRAVEKSRQYLRDSEEAAWRAAFRPHAIILTERQRIKPPAEPKTVEAKPVALKTNVVQLPAPVPGAVSKFMLEQIEAAPRSRVEVAELFTAYRAWCEAKGCRPLPVANFADAFTPVLEAVGIQRQERSGHVYLVGVKLAS